MSRPNRCHSAKLAARMLTRHMQQPSSPAFSCGGGKNGLLLHRGGNREASACVIKHEMHKYAIVACVSDAAISDQEESV